MEIVVIGDHEEDIVLYSGSDRRSINVYSLYTRINAIFLADSGDKIR